MKAASARVGLVIPICLVVAFIALGAAPAVASTPRSAVLSPPFSHASRFAQVFKHLTGTNATASLLVPPRANRTSGLVTMELFLLNGRHKAGFGAEAGFEVPVVVGSTAPVTVWANWTVHWRDNLTGGPFHPAWAFGDVRMWILDVTTNVTTFGNSHLHQAEFGSISTAYWPHFVDRGTKQLSTFVSLMLNSTDSYEFFAEVSVVLGATVTNGQAQGGVTSSAFMDLAGTYGARFAGFTIV